MIPTAPFKPSSPPRWWIWIVASRTLEGSAWLLDLFTTACLGVLRVGYRPRVGTLQPGSVVIYVADDR